MRSPHAPALALAVLAAACMKAPDPAGMGGARLDAAAAAPPRVGFAAPPGWTAVAPDQSFYLAKWEIEGGGLASLSWLGTGGGQDFLIANVQRWLGEWQEPGGGAIADYVFDTRDNRGRKTHVLELGGTLTGTRQLGGGEPRAGWRLYGAVVETGQGPLFLKLIGPADVVRAQTAPCWEALGAMSVEAGG